MDFVYDVETFPNCFLLAVEHAEAPFRWLFEISDWKDESKEILAFLHWLKGQSARLVGFNNLGFDYPVLHQLIRMGRSDAKTLYDKAMAIITSQASDDEDRWVHQVKPSDRLIEQLDLYRIHHFDNRSKSTSLKALEFNMRADTIEDLPFPVGTVLNQGMVDVLKAYNQHDVTWTKRFYHESIQMIRFREELTRKYKRDFLNHNDTKIGKDYFIMKLEEAGIACYDFSSETGRKPRQTRRPTICLKDAILPWISLEHPELQWVVNWFKDQTISETKGVFKDVTAVVNDFMFVFGLGGVHGSVDNEIIESDDDHLIVDLDVSSYYPNLAITNRFYPAHLGPEFVNIYRFLYEQRKQYPKKSAESAMLKLALNGVYGDSNNKFSVFYDPLFTMSITLNGQLLLCMLAEKLMTVPNLRVIQINTDGLTVRLPRRHKAHLDQISTWWMQTTGLNLEQALYRTMMVRDVNNYIAVYEDGSTKRKGAYEWQTEWHQNASALVVPKVAEKVLLEGVPIRKTLEEWTDKMDFMLRVKLPRSSKLFVHYPGHQERQIQNTSRYYVAKDDAGTLFKMMPPLKGKTDWRKIGIETGWGVQICNDIKHAWRPIDIDYYVKEVEKLVLGLR